MTDTRFTTVVDGIEELLSVADIDEIDEVETLLMFLLARPVGVEEVWEDDGHRAALEVIIHGSDDGTSTTFNFPLSLIDLARSCAHIAHQLGPYLRDDSAVTDATSVATLDDAGLLTALQGALGKVRLSSMASVADEDPWVADLHESSVEGTCQSTVGFEDHLCTGSAHWYVQLEILEYPVTNPRWEGKLCSPCLAGWQQWSLDEPNGIHVLSVDRIVSGA